MRRAPTMMVRELKTYFLSPLAYTLAALFMVIVDIFYIGALNAGAKLLIGHLVLYFSTILLAIFVPIITMRLLAGEKDSGTIEILLTDPVTDWDIVLGKFLAGFLCALFVALPAGVFALVFWIIGRMQTGAAPTEWVVVGSSIMGLVFLVGLFSAVGLLASSLTRNQIIGAVIGVVALIILVALGALQGVLSSHPTLSQIVDSLSIHSRLSRFTEGQIDTRSIFYFVSLTVLCLYLTVRSVESRKWR